MSLTPKSSIDDFKSAMVDIPGIPNHMGFTWIHLLGSFESHHLIYLTRSFVEAEQTLSAVAGAADHGGGVAP